MSDEIVHIRMLGEFSIALHKQSIDDGENRSRKVWLLLAYMIYCRKRPIPQEELIRLLWDDEEKSGNPINALKTMFHRVRTSLNQLDPSAGHQLIVRRNGNYAWNTDVPISFDVEEFDSLCTSAATARDDKQRLDFYWKALELYQGDFLFRLSSEAWVVPISAYYHNLYIQAVQEVLPLLVESQRKQEAVALCRKALEIEPYSEQLYLHLMRNLVDLEDRSGAISVYETMSQTFFDNFGVMPSEEIRTIYREAVRTVNDRTMGLDVVREQLREPECLDTGALICDYDFFKILYHAEARSMARNGDAVHIGLMSLTGERDKELSKRSLERAMENLRIQLQNNLRRGDVVSQCSVSQYILMLPQANYENSRMVCDRIIKSFYRQYPHSPAQLQCTIQPLEPSD